MSPLAAQKHPGNSLFYVLFNFKAIFLNII